MARTIRSSSMRPGFRVRPPKPGTEQTEDSPSVVKSLADLDKLKKSPESPKSKATEMDAAAHDQEAGGEGQQRQHQTDHRDPPHQQTPRGPEFPRAQPGDPTWDDKKKFLERRSDTPTIAIQQTPDGDGIQVVTTAPIPKDRVEEVIDNGMKIGRNQTRLSENQVKASEQNLKNQKAQFVREIITIVAGVVGTVGGVVAIWKGIKSIQED